MALLRRCLYSGMNNTFTLSIFRRLSIFPRLQLKESESSLVFYLLHICQNLIFLVSQKEDGSLIVFEGKYVSSSREPYLIKNKEHNDICPLCRLGLDVKHTDVLILSQFVRSDGCMLPRRITGLCKNEQKKITTLVAMAQKAGLMSILTPATSKKDPKLRKKWKKCNTYYDESPIVCK